MLTKKLNFLWFILLSILWGGSYIAIKVMVVQAPPFFSAAIRVGLALLLLAIIFCSMKKDLSVPSELKWKLWLIGLFPLGIPFALLFWGEQYISAGLAGILCASMPLWTFILGLLFLPQTTAPVKKIIGLLLGIIGVAIIFLPMISFADVRHQIPGAIAALFMTLAYATGAILNQRLCGHAKLNLQANLYHQCLSSLVFLLVLSFTFEKWPPAHSLFFSRSMWLASIYIGFFSTAIAWIIYFHLIREWGAVRAVTATYVAPVFAVILDFIFFNTIPRWSEIVGIAIILTGVVMIQFSRNVTLAKNTL